MGSGQFPILGRPTPRTSAGPPVPCPSLLAGPNAGGAGGVTGSGVASASSAPNFEAAGTSAIGCFIAGSVLRAVVGGRPVRVRRPVMVPVPARPLHALRVGWRAAGGIRGEYAIIHTSGYLFTRLPPKCGTHDGGRQFRRRGFLLQKCRKRPEPPTRAQPWAPYPAPLPALRCGPGPATPQQLQSQWQPQCPGPST